VCSCTSCTSNCSQHLGSDPWRWHPAGLEPLAQRWGQAVQLAACVGRNHLGLERSEEDHLDNHPGQDRANQAADHLEDSLDSLADPGSQVVLEVHVGPNTGNNKDQVVPNNLVVLAVALVGNQNDLAVWPETHPVASAAPCSLVGDHPVCQEVAVHQVQVMLALVAHPARVGRAA